MKKLAIITTHPIQYYAPVFKLLHQRGKIEIKVFYTLGAPVIAKYDPGFGKAVSWDIPLLDGYPYIWVDNTAKNPGTRHYKGIITPELTAQIMEWHADVILVFGWAYNSHLKAIRYFKNKIPVFFRGDSTLLNEPKGIKKIFKYIFLRWVYIHISHAFYTGKNNKAYFKKYGLKEKQLSFAPHAIDNLRFEENRAEEAKKLRLSLNISNEDILILFAGKFEPRKNVELLLSAFECLNRQNVHLLLVGNGVDEHKLKDQANKSNIAGNIFFLDFKNQSYMPVLYQAANLFCLPSKSESWGLSVNEAMACGKAILASDMVGCAVDLVKNGENGAIFKTNELRSLIGCLQELTADKAGLIKFGEQSQIIIKDWNFLSIAKAIENKILNETSGPH
jgi:glycosyltransferase involved in cell wall biosynthesis